MVACRPKSAPRARPARVGLALWLCASAVHAADWGATLGWVNDPVWRGRSQSDSHAAWLGHLSLSTATGWSADLGLTLPTTRDDRTDVNASASLQRSAPLGADWTAGLALTHYAYAGNAVRRAYDYDELSADLAWRGRLHAGVSASPDTSVVDHTGTLRRGSAYSLEIGWRERVAGPVAVDAGVGYYALNALPRASYAYGSVGLSASIGRWQARLARIDANALAASPSAVGSVGRRWVGSLLWSY